MQGEWLAKKLDSVPSDVDFVFLLLHHPPYTSSSDKARGGGHSARHPEQLLAQMLEERQGHTARFVVFSGHVHNYEHQEHNGVTYFVSGGGGARPYPIKRTLDDPLYDRVFREALLSSVRDFCRWLGRRDVLARNPVPLRLCGSWWERTGAKIAVLCTALGL